LRVVVESLLSVVQLESVESPKAVIAPHAGYDYSGPIAASAHARFAPARGVIKRFVLIGPSHFVGFEGLATSSADAFATPLGLVPIDKDAVHRIGSLRQVIVMEEAHAREHSLEVHLPFLQVVVPEFKLVPFAVGDASDEDVAEVIEALWGGPETRFVISSDLSHFHDYDGAKVLDAATSHAIEQVRPEDIDEDQACGQIPIRGLLRAARQHGSHVRTIDLRNSGDTAGPRDRVVGYGAFVLA
jgi:AmmeMemoRadiSam system protein B